MPLTEDFTITLSAKTANYIHQRIAEGNFRSPSDYFENLLVNDMLSPVPEDELVHWMNTEGARRLEAMHADPSIGLSSEQVFAGLLDEEEQAG